MMGNNEMILLHKLNSKMIKLIRDFNGIVSDLSELTEMVCQKELNELDKEQDIKLRSHM